MDRGEVVGQDAVGDPPRGACRIEGPGDGRRCGDAVGDVLVQTAGDDGVDDGPMAAVAGEVELQPVVAEQRGAVAAEGDGGPAFVRRPDAVRLSGLVEAVVVLVEDGLPRAGELVGELECEQVERVQEGLLWE
ncbi:hypothetical protein [Streptomyces sp. CC208A]|uniref:hypothetical protein n=1 Tax=Streptomyces sp. CC208A TaxID=3044573 RepID=UPI0024A9C577|nr:hypothetical protein [Streptomyces sp. CC208A]